MTRHRLKHRFRHRKLPPQCPSPRRPHYGTAIRLSPLRPRPPAPLAGNWTMTQFQRAHQFYVYHFLRCLVFG
jgi:hypothetical protein